MGDMSYKPTIGLEVHAELNTKTKMFCDCPNDPHEKHANENTCPICLGHPGTLPVINKKALESIVKVGMAIGGTIATASKFDRKNYFYPDLPKGYQISQYDQPFISGGSINGVAIERVHLEEDAGKLAHSEDGKSSLVDYNRAGCALMELVTKPVVKSAEEAVAFAKELQLILKHLGVSEADMEHGQMRVEVNISVSKDENFGTKVELKNLNSFRTVLDATKYEIERQSALLDAGKKVVQETRGWDENKQETFSQRSKEQAHDYRYFPEPDLPPLELGKLFDLDKIRAELPELPAAKRVRFQNEYSLAPEQAELLIVDRALARYFEESVSELGSEMDDAPKAVQLLFNYLTSDISGLLNRKGIALHELRITPENFADLIALAAKGEISSRVAKDVLAKMEETGLDPNQIVKQENLGQISDEGGLAAAVSEILAENPAAVEDYRKGKASALQFLIGKAMAKLKGRGNPKMLQGLFEAELKK
jgi:aspartyl-tRNA(Asn)/glutamyl-tRNA(Gln) amidotransferase subunit B